MENTHLKNFIKIQKTGTKYILRMYVIDTCYTQQLLTVHDKNPQPRHSIITFKRVKEMFPHMEEIEYKTGLQMLNKNKILTFTENGGIIKVS